MDGNSRQLKNVSETSWLTVPQQRLIAILVVAAQVGIATWWLAKGGLTGGLVRIDQASPLECQSQLNINECDWPELTLLPGISETMGRRIIRNREEQGDFRQLEDLRRVRGIGPKKLAQLRPYLLFRARADEATEKP
jgi:competence protein ComEA